MGFHQPRARSRIREPPKEPGGKTGAALAVTTYLLGVFGVILVVGLLGWLANELKLTGGGDVAWWSYPMVAVVTVTLLVAIERSRRTRRRASRHG